MKKLGISLFLFLITSTIHAQYVVDSYYQPRSVKEIIVEERAKVSLFEKYKDKAYYHLDKGEYIMFLYYSDQALKMGYYSAKLYYDRSVAYEAIHEYSKAKRWYKKALRKGYSPAEYALTQCKTNQREWKKFHK